LSVCRAPRPGVEVFRGGSAAIVSTTFHTSLFSLSRFQDSKLSTAATLRTYHCAAVPVQLTVCQSAPQNDSASCLRREVDTPGTAEGQPRTAICQQHERRACDKKKKEKKMTLAKGRRSNNLREKKTETLFSSTFFCDSCHENKY
jgi:hypothetical protein